MPRSRRRCSARRRPSRRTAMVEKEGWQRVAALGDIAPGQPFGAKFGERDIVLAAHEGQVYALAGICPHAYALMCDGFMNGGRDRVPAARGGVRYPHRANASTAHRAQAISNATRCGSRERTFGSGRLEQTAVSAAASARCCSDAKGKSVRGEVARRERAGHSRLTMS